VLLYFAFDFLLEDLDFGELVKSLFAGDFDSRRLLLDELRLRLVSERERVLRDDFLCDLDLDLSRLDDLFFRFFDLDRERDLKKNLFL
jgi:hypothetical protein